MAERIPLVLFGDGPTLPSGLARIARDLALRIVADENELGIRLIQVGIAEPSGYHWQPWDFYAFQPTYQDQGRRAVATVVRELLQEQAHEPIIWGIVDPARFYDISRTAFDHRDDVEIDSNRLWLYAPLDATTPTGALGGPAAECVWECERVLGYGPFGAGLLKRTIEWQWAKVTPDRKAPVSWLPHGIDTRIFTPDATGNEARDGAFWQWYPPMGSGAFILGCVATNQPRKDFGLLFATVADLVVRGVPIALWLHTDKLTGAWDVGELAHQFALRRDQIFVSCTELDDTLLAARYAASDVTIAPGLGEGFGYPIVESLACGTPVVHVNYAGGAELVPNPGWLVEPYAWRLEGINALQRPVIKPVDMADAVMHAIEDASRPDTRAYCAGAVAHLDWQYLWPRWKAWITKGLAWVPQNDRTPSTVGAGTTK